MGTEGRGRQKGGADGPVRVCVCACVSMRGAWRERKWDRQGQMGKGTAGCPQTGGHVASRRF